MQNKEWKMGFVESYIRISLHQAYTAGVLGKFDEMKKIEADLINFLNKEHEKSTNR